MLLLKRIISTFVAVLFLLALAPALDIYAQEPGDANGDGNINALDITKVERMVAGLDPATPWCDANQDGSINALDITKVERMVAGLDRESIFTVSPIDAVSISSIVTLGNLNPPGHVFPTDHIYLYITRPPGSDSADVVTLYSPGAMTVTGISASEHVNAGFTDYSIRLQPMADITVNFGHVSSLSEELFGDTSSLEGWTLQNEYSTGGETYRLWGKQSNIEVAAGQVLGTTGGNPGQWALDLGVYDERYSPANVANPQRWENSWYLNAVCPLSYYQDGPVLDQLMALISRVAVEGEALPCNSVMQDIPGTSQGNWFLSGVANTYPEDPHLALVHSNYDPSRAVLSIGNSIPDINSGTYEFTPQGQGLLNRDFPAITPDGEIYGFQSNGFGGVIIVTMPNTVTLWIEALPGATTEPASWAFSGNKTVFVR